MAASHAEAARGDEISAVATPDALRDLWRRSLDEMTQFMPHTLDPSVAGEVGKLADRYLAGRSPLVAERILRGRIVDGHGDLLADGIFCLADGPRILDALEFDDRLRWRDVVSDVGFLAMDLERLGGLDLATIFLDCYREYSAETHPASLEHHYIAYRALIRSKVSCLRGGADDARAYLEQCLRHLREGRVRLVIIGGLLGTGKSTLATGLGDSFEWPVLRSDEIRKQLAGLDPLVLAPATYGDGLYSVASTEATYDALLSQARMLLGRGESVIVDASFSKARWRAAAADLAANTRPT